MDQVRIVHVLRCRKRKKIGEILHSTVKQHWGEDWSKISNCKDWNSIKSKTLIITGSLDAIDIHQISTKYNTEIPSSEWIEIDNAAHTVIIEKPKKVNRLIKVFLKS